jgi:hypothetical protein
MANSAYVLYNPLLSASKCLLIEGEALILDLSQSVRWLHGISIDANQAFGAKQHARGFVHIDRRGLRPRRAGS